MNTKVDNERSQDLATCEEKRLKGNECYKLGKHKQAIKYYGSALVLAEDVFRGNQAPKGQPSVIAQLYCNRCMAHLAIGDSMSALRDAKSAVSSASGWPKSHFRLGQVLTARGAYMEAYASFKHAWHLDPQNNELVVACQRAYERMISLDRDPQDSEAQSARQAASRYAMQSDGCNDADASAPPVACSSAEVLTYVAITNLHATDSPLKESEPEAIADAPTGEVMPMELLGNQLEVCKAASCSSDAPNTPVCSSPEGCEQNTEPSAPQHQLLHEEHQSQLEVWLPLVVAMSEIELTLSPRSIILEAPGLYATLVVRLPFAVDEMSAKARFDRKRRKLTVVLPHALSQGVLV